MVDDTERPVIDAARIDLYGSLITAVQTTLESRGWEKHRVNVWRHTGYTPIPTVRFNYSHLEWRIHVTVNEVEELHVIRVRDASHSVPASAVVIIDDVLELDKRLAFHP